MTQTYSTDCTEYSTETIANQLATLGLPFTDLLARALTALLSGRKATLHQIATLLPGPQQAQSTEAKRQQLRRLLDHPALTPERWARAVASLLPKSKWVLALDRTQWKVGNKPVNLLVLAVVHAGCAVPILWNVLDKPGASDTHERKQLLQRFLALFGTQAIRFLSADREFIGRDWIAWLLSEKVPLRIRIKAGFGSRPASGYATKMVGKGAQATGSLCGHARARSGAFGSGVCPFLSGASETRLRVGSACGAVSNRS